MGISEDKVSIDKFDGNDFSWWKMQMEALLSQKDLDEVLEPKPTSMTAEQEKSWKAKDKKARGAITLAVSRNIGFNLASETTALGMMTALSNTYEKPTAANKVFLMRELFMSRMREGANVTEHVNHLTSILTRLASVGMKYDDETRACLLLSSLPDSWSGYVTAVTNSVATEAMTFEKMREGVLGEDTRRRNTASSSSTELLHAGRGGSRSSGSGRSRGRSSSRARTAKCWDCGERGHVRSKCPNKGEKGKTKEACTVDYESDDALLLSEVVSTDAWVLDSGASLHATHSSEGLRNVTYGDFGRVRLGTGEYLDVTGSGDLDLATSTGVTLTLENVRIIPRLQTSLISVTQLDDQGFSVSFSDGQWRIVRGNRIIARGSRRSSLYMTSVPSGDRTSPTETITKTRLAGSKTKRVTFEADNSKSLGNQLERTQGSERRRGIRDSGSSCGIPSQSKNKKVWVRKIEYLGGKFSPVVLRVGSVPLLISAADERNLWVSAEMEDVGLRPAEASTGPGN